MAVADSSTVVMQQMALNMQAQQAQQLALQHQMLVQQQQAAHIQQLVMVCATVFVSTGLSAH